MRPRDLLLLALVALSACRHPNRRRVMRDPRIRFATACEDSRFVAAPPTPIPSLHTMFPASARLRDATLTAGAGPDGVVATDGTRVTQLSPLARPATRVSVTAFDRGFAVAWSDPVGANVAVFSAGALVRTAQIPLCVGDPSVTEWGVSALAACVRHVTGEPDAIAVHRIDARGAVESLATTPCLHGDCRTPVITRPGASAYVAFISHDTGPEGIFTARLDLGRRRFDAPRLFARPAASVSGLAAASNPTRVALAWADNRAGAFGLYASSMNLAGEPYDGDQRLSIRYETDPASLAWDGGAFGITWSEPVSGGAPRSYFALLDRHGMRMGTQMRVYVPDDSAAMHPSLLFTGRGYEITYAKADGAVETRATGPRGCDAPP